MVKKNIFRIFKSLFVWRLSQSILLCQWSQTSTCLQQVYTHICDNCNNTIHPYTLTSVLTTWLNQKIAMEENTATANTAQPHVIKNLWRYILLNLLDRISWIFDPMNKPRITSAQIYFSKSIFIVLFIWV